MRFLILCLLSFTCTTLYSQKPVPLGKGWQVSGGIEVEVVTKMRSSPMTRVRAQDTLPPSGFPGFRFPAEIDLGNGPVTYYTESGYDEKGKFVSNSNRLYATLAVHHRNQSNIEYSAGIFFSKYKSNQRLVPEPNLPLDHYVTRFEKEDWHTGLRLQAVYNFFRSSRLQPYAGIQLILGVRRSRSYNTYLQFPNLGIEQSLGQTIVPRFAINTLLDFNLAIPFGINYRINNRWAIGIKSTFIQYALPGTPAAIQLRYLFGQNSAG